MPTNAHPQSRYATMTAVTHAPGFGPAMLECTLSTTYDPFVWAPAPYSSPMPLSDVAAAIDAYLDEGVLL